MTRSGRRTGARAVLGAVALALLVGLPVVLLAHGGPVASPLGVARGPGASYPTAPRAIGPVTFEPEGLPPGTLWTVEAGGRSASATAPAPAVLPTGSASATGAWTASATGAPPGTRYVAGGFEGAGSGGSTVVVPFVTQYLLTIATVPALPGPTTPPSPCGGQPFHWDNSCPQVNYGLDPAPGGAFVDAGALVVLNATALSIGCYSAGCPPDVWANLSFLSWTGSGSGSVNTTANLTSITVRGPVTETASFRYQGYCSAIFVPAPSVACVPANESLPFSESGLPSGTPWAVTSWSPGASSGLPETVRSTTTELNVTGPGLSGPTGYLLWGCPTTVFSGKGCEVDASPASPVELPQSTNVSVAFSAASGPPSGPFPLLVVAVGLPNGSTPWEVGVNGTELPQEGADALLELGSGPFTLSASPFYPAPGIEASVQGIHLLNLSIGSTWRNQSGGSVRVGLAGPAMALVVYNESFEVTVTAGPGGTVTPSNPVWMAAGGTLSIRATPRAGDTFLGWTGAGSGAYSGGLATANVSALGPVTEIAEFRPPVPTPDLVNVSEAGLPADVPFTVFLNGTGYTGNGSFTVALSPGPATVGLVGAFPGSEVLVRYLPASFTTSGAVTGGTNGIVVAGNGGLTVRFQVEFGLEIQLAGPGTTDPAPGVVWASAGTSINVTETPDAHAHFVAWNGTTGGTGPSVVVPLTGPATETALFDANPAPPPRTYVVRLIESGLPAGVNWTALVGHIGRAGNGPITLDGLNGTYPVDVPVVYGATGTRYAPQAVLPILVNATANVTVSVTFTTQYRVSLYDGPPAGPPSSRWVDAGTRLTLSPSPGPGQVFVNWTGAPYEGTALSPNITVDGPVLEVAGFAPTPPPAPSALSGGLWAIPVLAFVAGLAGALVLVRRRRRPPVAAWPAPPSA
jgi:hypothetical protein